MCRLWLVTRSEAKVWAAVVASEGGEAGGGEGVGGRGDQRFMFIGGAFTPRSTMRMNSTGHF